jgi:monoterpene epsilon-lactone hydrolase
MSPRTVDDSSPDDAAATVIVHSDVPGGPSYVRCDSKQPFVNPTSPIRSPEEVNAELNLNLGQTLINPNNKTLLWIVRFLNNFFVGWWEHHFYTFWKSVPLKWRQNLTFTVWKLYFPLHKYLLGRSTGIHKDASLEYHALSSLMWWGRLLPVTVQRVRFMLSQLTACTNTPLTSRVVQIDEPFGPKDPPQDQMDHCRVDGLWVHVADKPTDCTLLWIYGGAFLSGCAQGNLGPAENLARQTGMDVFIPTIRLVPEVKMKDMRWDVCLAYQWLSQQRKKVFVVGISSGAGLCALLMQSIAEVARGEAPIPDYLSSLVANVPMPQGAVLLGPFCDYTTPQGPLIHYGSHDLIVHQGVLDFGLPLLETHMGGSRRENSPVYRSFVGCPPLCVVTSEHEAVHEHAVALVNKARADGVPVTVGVWKYMCHVFCMLGSFIPEGEQSMQFVYEWLREQQAQSYVFGVENKKEN